MSLLAHQERVVKERAELGDRLNRLGQFLTGDKFKELPETEKDRLWMQHHIMTAYLLCLDSRIKDFPVEVGIKPDEDRISAERWECRFCGKAAPCVVEIHFRRTEYPHVEEQPRLRRLGCLCEESRVADWVKIHPCNRT